MEKQYLNYLGSNKYYMTIKNVSWFAFATIYFNKCNTAGRFCKEFNYIKMEILKNKGLYKPYVFKEPDE